MVWCCFNGKRFNIILKTEDMPEVNWQEIIDGDTTVEDVIIDIDVELSSIMNGTAWRDPFTNVGDMKNYVTYNIRNYTETIRPDIEDYFIWKYRI